jgi:hypothetical protein
MMAACAYNLKKWMRWYASFFFVAVYLRVWGQKKLNFENNPSDMN